MSTSAMSKRPRARSASHDEEAAPKRNRAADPNESDVEADVEVQSNDGVPSEDEAPADPVQAVAKRARSAGRARLTATQKRARFLEKYSGKTPEEILGEFYNFAECNIDLTYIVSRCPFQHLAFESVRALSPPGDRAWFKGRRRRSPLPLQGVSPSLPLPHRYS